MITYVPKSIHFDKLDEEWTLYAAVSFYLFILSVWSVSSGCLLSSVMALLCRRCTWCVEQWLLCYSLTWTVNTAAAAAAATTLAAGSRWSLGRLELLVFRGPMSTRSMDSYMGVYGLLYRYRSGRALFSVWCVLQTSSKVVAVPLRWTRIPPPPNNKERGMVSTGHFELDHE